MCMCIYYMDSITCIIVYNFVSNYTIDIPIYTIISPWWLVFMRFFHDTSPTFLWTKPLIGPGFRTWREWRPSLRGKLWILAAKMGISWEKGGFPEISWGHHGGYVLIFPDTWCSWGGQNWYNLGILTPNCWLGYGGPYKDGYITVYNPDCTPRYHKVRNWKLLKLLSWCWWTTFQASPGFWMVFYFQSF